ncbi:MAG: phosphoenolpyruvate synthase [Bacteriovorax sp.]
MAFIKWFEEISMRDLPEVGGKTASLGEMYGSLDKMGISVPYGFAITSEAYNDFVKYNKLGDVISGLAQSEKMTKDGLNEIGKKIRTSFLASKLPDALRDDILFAYKKLKHVYEKELSVAVRSSATAEDLPDASFAGQQESYLNVRNEKELLEKCVQCFSSLYTERAISYRQDKNISQIRIALSICVQVMVRSDLASSGVLFTIDTETGFKEAVVINASWGLGENIVKGIVNPDDYIVFKPLLQKNFRPILQKKCGGKEYKLIYQKEGGTQSESVKNVPCSDEEKNSFCLSDDEILTLSKWGVAIEDHYSKLKGKKTPMDIEWAKDGVTGKLFILQARPETVHSLEQNLGVEFYTLKAPGKVLLTGDSVGNLIGQGKVRIVRTQEELKEFKQGEVLVAEKTEPDWEPYLKKSAAIITDRGGRTCHAAIVSRELGIPAAVGTKNATELLKTGQEVTVACNSGSLGFIYEGILPFEHTIVTIKDLSRPKTNIMMNIANPTIAFKSSLIPNDGVGLLRMEFIIGNTIKIHPMALVHFDQIKDAELKTKIEKESTQKKNKSDFFVDRLAQGISMIAAAFYPKKVIVRFSDFKSDEYKGLIGGDLFEFSEENPMIGFRGASRYYHEAYREAFALECLAIKKVREVMGLDNLLVMIPFCRTVEEGTKVLKEMEKSGLVKGERGLEVYVMCEIPSNAILASEFAETFDGFSIGSNDLTQLTLGVDRNSSLLSSLFSEDDPAVRKMIEMAIAGCHSKGKKIGLCGQKPSDDPEFAKFLVKNHIDSISLNPDAVFKVTEVVKEMERQLY